ncbi:MAG: transposase [Sulfolobales archaeon]
MVEERWVKVPAKPPGGKAAGIDIGINNLLVVYVEDSSALLASGRFLKSLSFYWRKKIADYQSTLNMYGLKTSRRLRRMCKRWRRQVKNYIDWGVRNTVGWLYWREVLRVLISYPRYLAQNSYRIPKVNFI